MMIDSEGRQMVSMRRADGTISRTQRDVAVLSMLVAFEGAMVGFQNHIPQEYLWLYPIVHAVVLVRIAYLRATTTQPLQ